MTPGACGGRWLGLGIGAERRFGAGLRSGVCLRFGAAAGAWIGKGTGGGVAIGVGVGVATNSVSGYICISARCITDGPGSRQLSGRAAASKHNPKLKRALLVTPVCILALHYSSIKIGVWMSKRAERCEPNRRRRCIEPVDHRLEPPVPEPVGQQKHILVAR